LGDVPVPVLMEGTDPYDTPHDLLWDLQVVAESLRDHGSASLAASKVLPVIRAIELFGFHLCSLDLRQNSDVHEVVVADLLAHAQLHPDYRSLDEDGRVTVLRAAVHDPRRLWIPGTAYEEITMRELAILNAAALSELFGHRLVAVGEGVASTLVPM